MSPFSPSRKFRITTTEFRDKSDKTPPILTVQDFIQNGRFVILNGKTETGATVWVDHSPTTRRPSSTLNPKLP